MEKRTVDGIETEYVYDPLPRLSRLLMKTTDDVTTKYVYGLGLIGEEVDGEFKTYHYDYRGSTVAITEDGGNIIDTFEYDTYGKLLSHDGSTETPFCYNGRDGVMTEPNGLYYMRKRFYSPDLKRFINPDLIAGDITNAITINRYAYANNNPIMFVDPLGLTANEIIACSSLYYCDCEYDGSAGDFRRLEDGLPPKGCTHWVDITEKLNDEMCENAEELNEYCRKYGYFEAVKFFVDKVKPGGEWDFKSQEEWSLKDGYTYYYNGMPLRYDDIGNVHYGYVGGELFGELVLKIAGGAVQISTVSSSLDYWDSWWDDPRDQEMISFGYSLRK